MGIRSERTFFKFPNRITAVICLLFTVYCLLSLSSCGNGNGDPQDVPFNDSAPADIRAINEKIKEDRGNVNLYYERAKAWFSYKEFENAIGDMNIVLKIDSTKPDYHIFISDLYFTQNKTRDTRDALRKAIVLDSTNASALAKYSQLFFLLKKYDTATIYVNRSLHFNNANPVTHFQKGMILKEWGDTAKAIASFQSAVEFDQRYYDAWMQLGLLHSVKRNPVALGYFDNALNCNPVSIEALYAKGMFLQNSGEYENALKAYSSIIKLQPENLDAAFNTGAIFHEQKKINEAMQQFESIITRDPNFFRAYYGKGRCYEALGKKKEAIEEYKKCLALKPDYILASIQVERLTGATGKKPK